MAFPILAVLAAAQIVGGLIKSGKASDDAQKLTASRKPFQTTQEVLEIQNATENRAQQGYDAGTLDYLTNQIDRDANAAYGTAKRLGANPNDLSAIFDQQIQATMRVGAENNALNMENFSKYLGAKDLLSKNMEAEWASQQGIIKDQLQSAQQRRMEGAAQISNGINTGISAYAANQTSNLYNERTPSANATSNTGLATIDNYAPQTLTAQRLAPTTNVNAGAFQSVSSIVTPMGQNFYAGQRIIGIDEFGNPIYR